MINYYFYILKELMVRNIIFSIVLIVLIIFMWQGKSITIGKKCDIESKPSEKYKLVSNIVKIIYTRGLPVFFLIGIFYLNFNVTRDFINPNIIASKGTIEAMSYSSEKLKYDYTVKFDGTNYNVPKSIQDYKYLKKGKKYSIYYFEHSRTIVRIRELDSE
ncbi:hypothetical protein LY28_03000 [Ruminiclostridium sufflavum DSM 19573]|uniref:Uncharacterized protein n=1 Tax=Ruminiclostridium sufflavum DSM 19573 TaxID=1121337 RepID=A0A318XKQ7_9FIRM|nr:hypothetical protein [Ruminiclostridium sufflavum]PYG86572.1 hypothetical protein LY28_03000 [Ruminiclostridium sufflavum DSM 19573]